ncbi:MAG: type II toxin-antitoxin system VapC family toxin [Tepidisphaeraceae bacterium]
MILLDTCALIWLASDASSLSRRARAAIEVPTARLCCSATSAWEVGIAHKRARLELAGDPRIWFAGVVRKYRVRVIDVSWQIAMASTQLPRHHHDPADRIIVATALVHEVRIVSPDPEMPRYSGVRMIW